MEIKTFVQFEKFLKSRIPKKEAVFKDEIGLKRAKYFMRLIGNPQNEIKVIHIAGTSGKGSTAHLMSHALKSQGFRVGLSISPHMFDIRERMQIDNKLPQKKVILKYFNEILPAILKMEKSKYGMPSYFEINIGLAYYIFAKEKLAYAVMETGLGGRLDATNTVENKSKVVILTKIGFDHMEFLGNTVPKIAGEKCGIIRRRNIVISHKSPVTGKIIEAKCRKQNAELYLIKKNDYEIISSTPQKTILNFRFGDIFLKNINLNLIGKHQAENCSLALACLAIISERDKFKIKENKLRKALEKINIPGRFNISKFYNKPVIIDGAHNPQKMSIFIENLSHIFPKQKFAFLVAFKKGKDYPPMLEKIISLADKIFFTNFSTQNADNHFSSINPETLSKFLENKNFNNVKIIPNKKLDIQKAIQTSKKPVVITGSLYLIGSIYKYLK